MAWSRGSPRKRTPNMRYSTNYDGYEFHNGDSMGYEVKEDDRQLSPSKMATTKMAMPSENGVSENQLSPVVETNSCPPAGTNSNHSYNGEEHIQPPKRRRGRPRKNEIRKSTTTTKSTGQTIGVSTLYGRLSSPEIVNVFVECPGSMGENQGGVSKNATVRIIVQDGQCSSNEASIANHDDAGDVDASRMAADASKMARKSDANDAFDDVRNEQNKYNGHDDNQDRNESEGRTLPKNFPSRPCRGRRRGRGGGDANQSVNRGLQGLLLDSDNGEVDDLDQGGVRDICSIVGHRRSRGRGRGRGRGRRRGRGRPSGANLGVIESEFVEPPKANSRGSKDADNENSLTRTGSARRPWIARKPLYSTEYLDALEGTEMRCSVCPNYVTNKALEAREHLLKMHYNCARMNNSQEFTLKELRSALRTASLSMGPGARFTCVCGVEYMNSITFSIHLAKCSAHNIRLKLDEVVTVEVDGSNSGDAVSAADSNEKRRRKSALKAAVTFSRLAEEELADEDGNLPAKLKKRCIEDRTKDNVTEDDMCQRGGEDQDYKCSSSDEASNEPEEEYGVSDNDDSDFDEVSNADSRKSGSSIPKGGTKCLDILLSKFRGKYREPIPVPISDEKRTAWRQDLVLHGRIACKDCGVLYTTFCGMEYHYQRCNKLEYGYKCLRCSIYFPRGGNRALLSHLRICLDLQALGLEGSAYPCPGLMRVTSATRKHSQSPRDFVEFSKFYYDAPHATKIVHPSWKYERTMWNRIEPQEADQYLTAMTTSPLITIKRAAVGACDEDTPQRILDLHESVSEPGSEHDTIYVGGAVWAVKWVPLPRKLVDIKHTKDDGTAISVKGCDDDSANREKTERQQQHQEEDPIETELDSSSHQSSVHSDIDLGHEEYLLTVSHSKGSQPELMQLNKAGIVMMDERLSKGSLSLWAVSLDHSDDKEPQSSKTGIPKGTYQSMDENGNKKTRVRRCYTICHEWGFVARVEFCPSRAFTENRLGLLAVTSQAGFVRILALPHPTASDEGAFYLDPIPVAILEPAEMSGSLCVSWDPLRDHGHMLVGYANGNVEMFTLRHRTLLVTEDEALEPSKRLGSHGLSVSSVQWHFLADRRVAVSAGFDDNIIIWDIDSGAILGRCSRLVCRDMRTFQFLPSLVASYEESVTPSPCVTVYESGAYKRSESTILAYTVGTAFGLDVNHWRHMVAMADSAGLVTLAWVTNAGKLRNFRNRGLQVVLFQALQTFPEGVDTVSEDVAHGVGTVEFRDFVPSWEFPTPPQSLEITPSARLEYPLNSVLSVAFNPNYPTGDHLVASGLRCGIVRVSRVDYSTDSGVHNNLTFPVNDTRTRCRVSWRSKARKGTMSTKE